MKLHFKEVVLDRCNFNVAQNFTPNKFKGRHSGVNITDLDNATISFKCTVSPLDANLFKTLNETTGTTPIDVELSMECRPKKAGSFPYEIAITVSGLFVLEDHDDRPDTERQRFIIIEGMPILFGVLRDQVLGLTTRSYFGSILIPNVPPPELVDMKVGKKRLPAKKKAPGTRSKPQE